MTNLDHLATAATPRSRRWTSHLLRDVTLILLVVGLVLAWGIFRHPSQGAMLYWQYRALRASFPDDQPPYVTSPALRALTVAAMVNFGDDTDDNPAGATDDACTPLPPHLVPPGGTGDPPGIAGLNPYMGYVLPDGMQVVFCHALATSDGQRLVVVTVGPDRRRRAGLFPGIVWEVVVIDPAGWTGSPHVVARRRGDVADPWLDAGAARFFAGHVDGDRFVVPYAVGAHRGELSGRVIGRRVDVQLATSPETTKAR
jgi:hypothetical protein